MGKLILIFLGGGCGSLLRYLVGLLAGSGAGHAFPWGTFAVNIVGSFLIGVFYTLSERLNLSPEIRLLLTVGFCGGFTTFSAFSGESLSLFKEGMYVVASTYILLSIVIGILAVLVGAFVAR